ncbi:MAG: DegT/DnrJ/EryC1/StrS aminotransferase family protein [Patescibacteria group bacterium]|nr:DegT/DnrJ/EryC1/StrS aminotransferase family protein [Patescibacteria group bacterium]
MIKLIKSTFYNEELTKKELVDFIKFATQLSFGSECEKFENNFAKYQGRKYCTFFNSGSSANLALIQALLNLGKLKKGDTVGFSALTWATNVMPFIQLGLNPVPADVEIDTLNVSSAKLKKVLLAIPLKAFFLTNLLGFCDDIDEIWRLCKEKKIILIEDNCESLGTVYKGKKLGNFGLAGTFSFFVGHHMSMIEGGAVCTDDEELANMLRMVRAHGWDRHLNTEAQSKLRGQFGVDDFYARYSFYDLAYNLRPTEINGFLGNIQLRYLDEIVTKRKDNFIELADFIYGNKNKFLPIKFNHIDLISNFAVPILCRTKAIKEELIKKCEGKIEIRPIVGGDITKQPFFKKYNPDTDFSCLNAGFIHENGFYFGNNPELTNSEIQEIKNVFQ